MVHGLVTIRSEGDEEMLTGVGVIVDCTPEATVVLTSADLVDHCSIVTITLQRHGGPNVMYIPKRKRDLNIQMVKGCQFCLFTFPKLLACQKPLFATATEVVNHANVMVHLPYDDVHSNTITSLNSPNGQASAFNAFQLGHEVNTTALVFDEHKFLGYHVPGNGVVPSYILKLFATMIQKGIVYNPRLRVTSTLPVEMIDKCGIIKNPAHWRGAQVESIKTATVFDLVPIRRGDVIVALSRGDVIMPIHSPLDYQYALRKLYVEGSRKIVITYFRAKDMNKKECRVRIR